MRTAVIVPVKDLGQAKSRLAPLLSLAERQELAAIMLDGVLDAVRGISRPVERWVVTSYPPAIENAEARGMSVLRESKQVSESHSVDSASVQLAASGVDAVLRVPLDLPVVTCQAIEEVLEKAESGVQGVLVPSLDGTGTNAVYRRPPTLFPSRFGPGSLMLHEQSLRALNVPYSVFRQPALALDMDDASDVEALMRNGVDCPALRYLMEIGVPSRLSEMKKAGA
jgi:2-phospho-L-lactate guanylyltransferase